MGAGHGAVLAWRCWALHGAPGILSSHLSPFWPFRDVEWTPGWQGAECAFHDHPAPDGLCRCGWRGQPHLGELVWWLCDFKKVRPRAVGLVEVGGTVLRGDRAHPEIPGILRAELVRVVGPVVVAPGYEHHIGPLARRYGVEALPSSADRFDRSWVRSVPADFGVDVHARPGRAALAARAMALSGGAGPGGAASAASFRSRYPRGGAVGG